MTRMCARECACRPVRLVVSFLVCVVAGSRVRSSSVKRRPDARRATSQLVSCGLLAVWSCVWRRRRRCRRRPERRRLVSLCSVPWLSPMAAVWLRIYERMCAIFVRGHLAVLPPSVCLSVCLTVCLYACLTVCLYACLTYWCGWLTIC